MKKICYVTTIALTIKAFFVPQIKDIASKGYEVTVICSPDDNLKYQLGENVKYVPINIARGISPGTLFKSIIDLTRVFKKEKFDIVQYSTPNAAFCASIAAKIAKIKIRNYHLMGLRYLGFNGITKNIFRILEKLTCVLSTHIECITQSNLEMCIREKLFMPEKATIVWNGSTGGVDLHRFDVSKKFEWRKAIRQKLNLKEDDFVFGFVGRITRDKGINEIIQAFRHTDKKCKLIIIGDAEGIKTLDSVVWNYALENPDIIICDSVLDIECYYAAIDVLLLPSYREGFGMVIAESAAMGVPAIVTNIPGPIDVVDVGKTAFTVEVGNIDELAKEMSKFLNNPDLATEMSGNCVEFVRSKFDSEILCEKIIERKEKLIQV